MTGFKRNMQILWRSLKRDVLKFREIIYQDRRGNLGMNRRPKRLQRRGRRPATLRGGGQSDGGAEGETCRALLSGARH